VNVEIAQPQQNRYAPRSKFTSRSWKTAANQRTGRPPSAAPGVQFPPRSCLHSTSCECESRGAAVLWAEKG